VDAALLESWLGCPAAPVVGEGFAPLGLFNTGKLGFFKTGVV
jgi:hypothetical protein